MFTKQQQQAIDLWKKKATEAELPAPEHFLHSGLWDMIKVMTITSLTESRDNIFHVYASAHCETWFGRSMTGTTLKDYMDDPVQQQILISIRMTAFENKCGTLSYGKYTNQEFQTIFSTTYLSLPVVRRNGMPGWVGIAHHITGERNINLMEDGPKGNLEARNSQFIDLGFGVPSDVNIPDGVM